MMISRMNEKLKNGSRTAQTWIDTMLEVFPRSHNANVVPELPRDESGRRQLGSMVGMCLSFVSDEIESEKQSIEDGEFVVRCCTPTAFDHAPALKPQESIVEFAERLARIVPVCSEALVVALVFIDRIITTTAVPVRPNNVHKLLTTCVVLASKLTYDRVFTNKFFAKVARMSVHELNSLEIELMRLLDRRVLVSEEEFQQYSDGLMAMAFSSEDCEEVLVSPKLRVPFINSNSPIAIQL